MATTKLSFARGAATSYKSTIDNYSGCVYFNTTDKKIMLNGIEYGGYNGLVPITYAELKTLRDNSQLVPGVQYRITDYECTTVQENTKSAGHKFDIIVTADDEKTLNENARACAKKFEIPKEAYFPTWYEVITYKGEMEYEGKKYYCYGGNFAPASKILVSFTEFNFYRTADNYGEFKYAFEPEYFYDEDDDFFVPAEGEWISFKEDVQEDVQGAAYFSDCNLAAWELKYSLDNDTTKFAWASEDKELELIQIRANWNGDTLWAARTCKSVAGRYLWQDVSRLNSELTPEHIEALSNVNPNVWMIESWTTNVGDRADWDGGDCVVVDHRILNLGGKGVIYYMKDEWNNECPYDFKNIMFKRYYDEDAECYKLDEDNAANEWCYTFCMLDRFDGKSHDLTVDQFKYLSDDDNYYIQHGNVIKAYYDNNIYRGDDKPLGVSQKLNDIVFVTNTDLCFIEEYQEFEFYSFSSNVFGNNCVRNTFGSNCSYNTFGNYCENNTFGNNCSNNTFGSGCPSNTFGNNCFDNTLGNYCENNTFGQNYVDNTLGNYCSYNTFGNYCENNTFGNFCFHNTFGRDCSSNIFGVRCEYNIFGNTCWSNTFGDYCSANTFVERCTNNTFGSTCVSNTFNKSYMKYITLENGVQYVDVTCTDTTSEVKCVQHVHINSSVSGTSPASRKTCTIATAGNTFLTTFGSTNDVKINV